MQDMGTVSNIVAIQPPPVALDDKRWWTVEDVAEYRGVKTGTVYLWVRKAKALRAVGKEGGIPFSQPRGMRHLRFKPEAVRAFFEGESSTHLKVG